MTTYEFRLQEKGQPGHVSDAGMVTVSQEGVGPEEAISTDFVPEKMPEGTGNFCHGMDGFGEVLREARNRARAEGFSLYVEDGKDHVAPHVKMDAGCY